MKKGKTKKRPATPLCERSANGSCVSALSQDGVSILVGRGHTATVGEGGPDPNRPDLVVLGWTRRDGPRPLTGVMEEDSGQNDGDGDEGSGDREARRSRRKEKKEKREKRRAKKKSNSESKKHSHHDKDKDGCLGGSSGKHSKSKSRSEHIPDKKMMQGTVTSGKQFPIAEITFESSKCGVYDHPSVATTAETSGFASGTGVTIDHINQLRQELLEAQESEGPVLKIELRIHNEVERLVEKQSRRQLELATVHENLRTATDEREQLKLELENVTKDNACLRRSLADLEDNSSDRRMDELLESMSEHMVLMKINRQKRKQQQKQKQLGRKISSPK